MDDFDFNRFYLCHYALSYVTALDITNDLHEAQDVVQTVFCKAWALRTSMHDAACGKKWIVVATKNAAIDAVRRRASHRQHRSGLDGRVAESAEQVALRNIEGAIVWHALDGLPKENRTLLRESFIHRRSHANIAARWNIPLGTVKTRIRSSLTRMRSIIGA
ncbi:MAG TPA: sigma-70 family RNA polymerase sigma factor [Candidatus Tumulicola sp.]|jgi:RNA polymerase sigma-70 factor (ECF subfamily)